MDSTPIWYYCASRLRGTESYWEGSSDVCISIHDLVQPNNGSISTGLTKNTSGVLIRGPCLGLPRKSSTTTTILSDEDSDVISFAWRYVCLPHQERSYLHSAQAPRYSVQIPEFCHRPSEPPRSGPISFFPNGRTGMSGRYGVWPRSRTESSFPPPALRQRGKDPSRPLRTR